MSSQQLYIEYLDFKHNYYIALRGLYTGDLSPEAQRHTDSSKHETRKHVREPAVDSSLH